MAGPFVRRKHVRKLVYHCSSLLSLRHCQPVQENTRFSSLGLPDYPVHFVFLLASKERQRAVMPACVCVTKLFCTT